MFAWDDLKHFLAFARSGSTLAAAKALGVNQSTVARRLAELEERLGRRLIERHANGYRLTKLGERLRPYAERVEEAVTAFDRQVGSCDEGLTGTVRVTCASTLGDRLIGTRFIDSFHARYPSLKIELVMTDRYLDLSKGEADVAIRAGEPSDDQVLVGRKLADAPWAVYASRSYVERHGRPECPEDIKRHSVVAFSSGMAEHSAARWLRSVAPHATVAARCDGVPALVLAVKSGAGLGPLPVALAERESDLVRLIDNIPGLGKSYYLLMHRDMRHTPRVRAFFDFVVSEIKAFRAIVSEQVVQSTVVGQATATE